MRINETTRAWHFGLRGENRKEWLGKFEKALTRAGGKLARACSDLGLPHRTVCAWIAPDAPDAELRDLVERVRHSVQAERTGIADRPKPEGRAARDKRTRAAKRAGVRADRPAEQTSNAHPTGPLLCALCRGPLSDPVSVVLRVCGTCRRGALETWPELRDRGQA